MEVCTLVVEVKYQTACGTRIVEVGSLMHACGNWDVATIVDIRLLENITEENKKDVIDLLKYRFMKSCLVATDMWQLICGSICTYL